MILIMEIVRYLCTLTCASWIPRLRTYGFGIGWYMGFEIVFTVVMVVVAPVESPLVYFINISIYLAI